MKYLNHINHIPFEGGRELIVNFNQLQQMQNVIHEQRRENVNAEGNFVGAGWGGNLAGNNNGGGGALDWAAWGFIRVIQILSIFTIAKFLFYNSNIEVFIIIAFLCITYFVIDCMKTKKRGPG